jgi:hypothetical protein
MLRVFPQGLKPIESMHFMSELKLRPPKDGWDALKRAPTRFSQRLDAVPDKKYLTKQILPHRFVHPL